MDKENFAENWEKHKDALRKQHPDLTEDDLRYKLGEEEELLKRLQEKLGKTKEDIRNWLRIMG
jgi:uncharacterized protein YjbJ (UPF0337 family)